MTLRPDSAIVKTEWFYSYDNVLELGTYLTEQLGWTTEELLSFFEKPWKWSDEWDEYQASEDDEGTAE